MLTKLKKIIFLGIGVCVSSCAPIQAMSGWHVLQRGVQQFKSAYKPFSSSISKYMTNSRIFKSHFFSKNFSRSKQASFNKNGLAVLNTGRSKYSPYTLGLFLPMFGYFDLYNKKRLHEAKTGDIEKIKIFFENEPTDHEVYEFFDHFIFSIPIRFSDKQRQEFRQRLSIIKKEIKRRPEVFIEVIFDSLKKYPDVVVYNHLVEIIECLDEKYSDEVVKVLTKKISDFLVRNNVGLDTPLQSVRHIKNLDNCLKEITPYPLTAAYFLVGLLNSINKDKILISMTKKAFEREQHLSDTHYIFYHGQSSYFLPSEQWYTFLKGIKANKDMSHFLDLHVKSENPNEDYEGVVQLELASQGNKSWDLRQRILFTNYAFFGNSTQEGSCTAQYIMRNYNQSTNCKENLDKNIEYAFQINGYQGIYQKYEPRLKQLQKKWDGIAKYGTLMLIAIEKDKVNQLVYPTRAGGPLKKVFIEGVGKTRDMKVILETLKNNPEKITNVDRQEFAIIMTENAGKDPNNMIVEAIPGCDSQDYQEYLKLLHALQDDVKKDILARSGNEEID